MKILYNLLVIISSICHALPTAPAYVSTKESLEKALLGLERGESLWIVGALADSYENEILREMAQEPLWEERLKGWEPLDFKDYRLTIRSLGRSIMHTEIHREFVQEPSLDWISQLGLQGEEHEAFKEEFLFRFSQSRALSRQLLIQVQWAE